MTERKQALVTGAAGGIAVPTLKRMHEAGYALHLVDIDEERLKAAAAPYPDATWHVSRLESPADCAAAMPPGDAPIEAVVHLAGIFVQHDMGGDAARETYDATMAANATNAFDLMGAAEKRLADGAAVVFISSLALTRGSFDHVAYSMSKGAVLGLTRGLALRYAGRQIRVNALAPGIIDTAMPAHVLAQRRNDVVARVPMGRIGQPEEVSGVIAFLLSKDASYITGQLIAVDGGVVFR